MKYKVGDRVRIVSKEWIDAQEKDEDGDIWCCGARPFVQFMFRYAGREAVITRVVDDNTYEIDIDSYRFYWTDKMFDPDYTPADKPLSPEDAIRAMLEGETLADSDGRDCFWDKEVSSFVCGFSEVEPEVHTSFWIFKGLCRRPSKRKRNMTRWEILAWVNSEESREWIVRVDQLDDRDWVVPQFPGYNGDLKSYQRARLLPDNSGVDESTIQGFEVEE
jgi:hypothetical protein